jgi:hypothetical protein
MGLSKEIKVDKETGLSYAREGLYSEFYRIRGDNTFAVEHIKPQDLKLQQYKPMEKPMEKP